MNGGIWLHQALTEIMSKVWFALSPWITVSKKHLVGDKVLLSQIGVQDKTTLSQDQTELLLVRKDEESLYLAVRHAIRQYLIYRAEHQGWIQIHASAARLKNGQVVVFTGQKRAGKTSSVLALCTHLRATCLIANDRILMNPEHKRIIGFPSGVGLGRVARQKLNLKQKGQFINGKYWLWPQEIAGELDFGLAKSGEVALVLAPQFRRRTVALRVHEADCRQLLIDNIEYDALTEENWWEIKRPSNNSYGIDLSDAAWPSTVNAFEIVTKGITPEYIETISTLCNNAQ